MNKEGKILFTYVYKIEFKTKSIKYVVMWFRNILKNCHPKILLGLVW
jgi:hypothetical protein